MGDRRDGETVTEAADGGSAAPGDADAAAVQVYWRPGCGFCGALMRRMDGVGLAYDAHDIWQDEQAATFVRRAADGDETVPTVRIGDVALINPTLDEVVIELAEQRADAVPEGFTFGTGGGVGRARRRVVTDVEGGASH
ncbi:MAG: hypothetical protein JJT89_16180 [Nitriliruptoraceae bacterium]|nr:hypothetical protein [Nitriliruptoraceae bacterium]